MKFQIQTFYVIGGACPRRKVDAQTAYNYFIANGLKSVKKIRQADIIYVISCGAFITSEKKTLETIEKIMLKKKTNAIVAVGGCLASINPAILKSKNVIQIPYPQISELDVLIDAKFKYSSMIDANIIKDVPNLFRSDTKKDKLKKLWTHRHTYIKAGPDLLSQLPNLLQNKRTAFGRKTFQIMISRGCLGNCSYCSIKYAHGRLQSKSVDEIIEQFKKGLTQG